MKLDVWHTHIVYGLVRCILFNYSQINVGGELLLGGAYSDSVFKANSDFSDLYTSIKRRL